jgi:hypothetical protein
VGWVSGVDLLGIEKNEEYELEEQNGEEMIARRTII